ncbi:response regulator [Oxalobacteraceae bacterium OM1]|nr:response regulator [Oxalobacteraceae bacterium OM1]
MHELASAASGRAAAAPVRLPMLLLEADALLRRTVVLTARSLGLGEIHEASSSAVATRLLRERPFRGAIIALDLGDRRLDQYDLSLIDVIRHDDAIAHRSMPIAVMLERCDAALAEELRRREVNRVILKPFRARTLLDTFSEFRSLARHA